LFRKRITLLSEFSYHLGYELPTFRIRIGKYRSLYRINYEEKMIIVVKIDKREKAYD